MMCWRETVMMGGFLPVSSPSGKPWLFKGLSGSGYKIMYQSIPSLTILPPGRPQGSAYCYCPGGQVFTYLSLPGGSGF